MIRRGHQGLIGGLIGGLMGGLLLGLAQAAGDPYLDTAGAWGQAHDDLWGLKRVGAQRDLSARGDRPVVVAVIDTGLDYFHPDLDPGSVWRNPDETLNGRDDDGNGYVDDVIGWDFIDRDNNPWDGTGHGTHVAGIIAAARGNGEGIAGLSPPARIMPLRALNLTGHGLSTRVAEAVYYAVANGARVINLSLTAPRMTASERRAVEYAGRRGVLVVLAAGNEGRVVAADGLAGLDNVIVVGASGPDDRRAPFSNHGAGVDLVAPGVDILSLRARSTDLNLVAGLPDYTPGRNFVGPKARYYRASGTSFAAPFVSGAAALILSRRPELDTSAVKRMIVHSARDIGTPGVDLETGYGLLDVAAALAADPRYFLAATIRGIEAVGKPDGVYVRVNGGADADRFRAAWVEYGQGENPAAWRRAPGRLKAPLRDGVLADLPAELFRSAGVWTLRLVVEHENGARREARHVLRLE